MLRDLAHHREPGTGGSILYHGKGARAERATSTALPVDVAVAGWQRKRKRQRPTRDACKGCSEPR